MFKRKNFSELPVNLRQSTDKKTAYSYSTSHSRNMRRVSIPSLSLLSVVGYIWTAVGLFGFFYGLFALLNSRESVELVCPLGVLDCTYSVPQWVVDDGRVYNYLPRNRDGNRGIKLRKAALGSQANVVSIDDEQFIAANARHSELRSTKKQSHTVGISFVQPKGRKRLLYMNFDGMSKRQARERAKRFTKHMRSAKLNNRGIHIKETYYTRSLPVVYIVLGMFTCIARLLAWDLRSISYSSMNRTPNYPPVQKKTGL